jgi:hypothetical protein
MLRASARVAMHKLGQKTNIRIPSNLARMMFGVIDTTGQLQYGQVFFQYTNNLHDANPNMDGRFSVHTGPVMVRLLQYFETYFF